MPGELEKLPRHFYLLQVLFMSCKDNSNDNLIKGELQLWVLKQKRFPSSLLLPQS
jgi:hypothetical protein